MNTPAAAAPTIPWQRGVAWLLFLGPFFFLSYGFANSMAARWQVSDSLVYDWERHIPFLPWTILPYWSIDLFYGLSFLLCRTALQVDRHALRLLTAQLVSVACFLAFPLRFSFSRPDADGLFGALFDALAGFDLPYNQAPSLHISLLVILWVRFAAATRGPLRGLVDAWAALIAVSVLTTYQHHFIDLPSGALVGLLCLWLWPATLRHAAATLDTAVANGDRVLVCCALGYSRSALSVAAWLLQSGRCDSVDAAIARIRAVRPQVVFSEAHLTLLKELSDGQ
jgi:membrane-associated phospholipid phosphatase